MSNKQNKMNVQQFWIYDTLVTEGKTVVHKKGLCDSYAQACSHEYHHGDEITHVLEAAATLALLEQMAEALEGAIGELEALGYIKLAEAYKKDLVKFQQFKERL